MVLVSVAAKATLAVLAVAAVGGIAYGVVFYTESVLGFTGSDYAVGCGSGTTCQEGCCPEDEFPVCCGSTECCRDDPCVCCINGQCVDTTSTGCSCDGEDERQVHEVVCGDKSDKDDPPGNPHRNSNIIGIVALSSTGVAGVAAALYVRRATGSFYYRTPSS